MSGGRWAAARCRRVMPRRRFRSTLDLVVLWCI
jgi:hypothetical protein